MALIGLLAVQAASAEEVNVYASRHDNADQALDDAFTEASGVAVDLIEAKGDALIERIAAAGENGPAGVFVTMAGSRIGRAVDAGLFRSIASDALSMAIPENRRHPDGLWYGLSTGCAPSSMPRIVSIRARLRPVKIRPIPIGRARLRPLVAPYR